MNAVGHLLEHRLRRASDRLFAREYTRTNWYGAQELFPVGRVICGYRVTRHRIIPGEPWATYVVYARKHQEDAPE